MKPCIQCHQNFEIQSDELEFLNKMDFQYGSKVIQLPEPILCPDCRNQGRTAHRNEKNLYNRKSDLSGKQSISLYSQNPAWGKDPYKIYIPEEWHSDKWDGRDYGRDYDFNRSFFEQFAELSKAVPRLSLMQLGNENSPYTTGTGYCKNCHLINSSENCEDCYYGKLFQSSKSSVDCSYLYDSELCYECFSVEKSYGCCYVSYSQNCSDCWFSENLRGCKNCFFCTNLSNKEYYFMNQPLGKAEYHRRVEEFKGSHRNFRKALEILKKMQLERIYKYSNISNSENCTGDFISNSKDCLNCYDVNDSRDCRNVWVGVEVNDVYDCSNMYLKQELQYQVLGTISPVHCAFTLYVFHSSDVLYSEQIFNSKNLFGCSGLNKHEYCIFNKQYSKPEYEELVPRIIEHMKSTGEWGHFFPVKYSPHGYNETLAHEYYPLSKQEVLSRGWNWHEDTEGSSYQGSTVELPDHIKEVKEDLTDQVLTCEESGKPYKIMKQELSFYKRLGLPIPRLCPDQRYVERLSRRNPRTLYERQCQKCQVSVKSTFAPDRPEQIYCEECYQQSVC